MKRSLRIAVGFFAVMAFGFVAIGEAASVKGMITTDAKGVKKAIKITKDQAVCGKNKLFKENLMVSGSGGLKNAIVIIDGAGSSGIKKMDISQSGCRFVPHVIAVKAGSDVTVNNNDGISHNFHTYGFENDPVNFSQPGDMKTKKVSGEAFEIGEIVEVKCDIHEWMNAWIVVAEGAAVGITDGKGNFKIDGVKPGKYKARIWHETLGEVEKEITVKDGDNTFNAKINKK